MTIVCPAPDAEIGVAVRLSTYLDCQSRALGENGFQAFVGGPLMVSLLSGLVTIFVALIGYRLILGQAPSLRDGVGWTVRLGIVLALVTSWPAFQILVFRVAANGPIELASLLLPAAGLPSERLEGRVQTAYDIMRLGSALGPRTTVQQLSEQGGPGQSVTSQSPLANAGLNAGLGQPPLPGTASLFVVSTLGLLGAFRLAVGFLLAVAPLALLSLLFDATLGVFSGWIRALVGSALAVLAATIVSAIHLISIETELAHAQVYASGLVSGAIDQQALTTISAFFAVVALIASIAAARMAGAFRLQLGFVGIGGTSTQTVGHGVMQTRDMQRPSAVISATHPDNSFSAHSRVAAVADALALTVRREQLGGEADQSGAQARRTSIAEAAATTERSGMIAPLGLSGRRTTARTTRSGRARDRVR